MAEDAGSTKRRALVWGVLVASASVSLAGCSAINPLTKLSSVEPLERVVGPHDKVPPGGGRYQVGKAYTVNGRTYVPRENPSYDEVGFASWYGGEYHHGTRTANGEVYDRDSISAAHPTMPLPSYARVTSLATGRSIIVRVNDRGPYARDRIMDLSEKTANLLGIKGRGVSKIRVQYVARAGLGGSDQNMLMASLRGPDLAPGLDEHRLLAAADLPVGPRRAAPTAAPTTTATIAPVLVADARPQKPANVVAPARPTLPTGAHALVASQDAWSFDLAGVDATAMRAAARVPLPKPAATSAEVVETQTPRASGAPMSIMPLPPTGGAYDTSALPAATSQRASFAAESRISAAFASFGEGRRLSNLPE